MATAKPKITASPILTAKPRQPAAVKSKTVIKPSASAKASPKVTNTKLVEPKIAAKLKSPTKVVGVKLAEPVVPAKPKVSSEAAEKNSKKPKKAKVIRDSFTMPEEDYTKLAVLKKKCLAAGVSVKKSELLRAGVNMLETLPIAKLKGVIAALVDVKTGRPSTR